MKKNSIILKILSFSILKKGAKIKELFLRTVKRAQFLEKTWSTVFLLYSYTTTTLTTLLTPNAGEGGPTPRTIILCDTSFPAPLCSVLFCFPLCQHQPVSLLHSRHWFLIALSLSTVIFYFKTVEIFYFKTIAGCSRFFVFSPKILLGLHLSINLGRIDILFF